MDCVVHPLGADLGNTPEQASTSSEPRSAPPSGGALGPDPVIGAGITLLGIFVMGTGGAANAHYVFDVGVGLSVIGAITFVLCVALSAMKQDRASRQP
jgi:hypothetical protein